MTAPRRLQLRRGNTAATSTYVGAPGELVVDTTTNTLYLHDGSTVGGFATTTNTASITNQISSVNANITLANTGMQGYVNLANTIQSAQLTSANLGIIGYVNLANTIQSAQFTSANLGIIGYIDLANTIQSAQVNAANLAITAANLGMKGYVDSVASQSIYGNGNVKSYLTQFDGNIIPSANVTYSLGNVTHRWKDLYISGNTIYLGDATISTEGSRLVTTGVAISPPTGAVGFANVYYESPTDFAQIRSYYVDNNFGYTANLKSWATAPIVWDSLRSAKIYHAGSEFADFDPLDTVGGRYANAVCTLDATGNIASLTITDGGVGYDAYYPYYATDPTGYVYNHIGASYEGAPQGIGFRRINLVPTTASDIGNVPYLIRTGGSGGPTITRGPASPTVGSNTYTWTGNSGSTFSITIDWTANTSTSFSYTPALPPLTSAQEWQDWLLDYQAAYAGPTTDPLYPDYSPYAYLFMEALPSVLIYDITNAIWFLNVENPTFWQTLPGLPVNLSDNYFRVMLGRTAIGVATLESGYGVPVYWSRGLSADTGISSGGDMTVAGDLRVAGDLYVSPTSIYMGDLRISAADGNLKVNTGIKFSDDSVQSTAYSNVQVGVFTNLSNYAYTANVTAANVGIKGYVDLANTIQSNQISAANLGMRGYVDNQITTITGSAPAILDTLGELANALGADANLSVTITSQIANVNANITTANLGMRGYVDSQSFYSNAKVATYLPTYSGNISANISKAGYTWTFGADGTTQFPGSKILAPAGESITMQSDNYSQLMWENANLTVAPNMAINSNFYVAQNNATLDIGYRDGSSTQLIKSWYWNADGNLKLPSGGYIINSDDSIYGGGDYSNVQVATYLPTYSGVVTASNVAVAGNVTAQYLFGNGSQLTGITAGNNYSNVQVATYLPTYTGNIANVRLGVSGVLTFADGTTQITAGGGSYSNVQVATYLPTYGGAIQSSNVQTTTANIQTTTAATNTATGALRVMGGAGVAGTVFAGQLNTTGNLIANAISAYSLNTIANVVASVVSAGTINSAGNVLAQNIIGTIATASQTGITAVGTLATLTVSGNVTSSNFVGSTPNVQLIANTSITTFDIYGNVTFPGNLTVPNSVTVGGNLTVTGTVSGGTIAATVYLLEAYASVTYTLPGSFTEDPCRYSVVSANVNVSSSWFDTSTYTFTPQKAGYWEITAAYDVYRNAESSLAIKKNNSIVASAGSFNAVAQQITKIIYLNGSTDSANVVNVGGAALSRSQYDGRSWFQARWIGA